MSSLNIMKLLKKQNLLTFLCFFWCFHCQYCLQFYFVCWFCPHFLSSFISVQGENNKGCNNIAQNLAEYESLRDALPLCLAAMFRWCKCNYFYGVHVMAFLWTGACTHVQCPFLTLSNDLFLQSRKQRIKMVEWFKRCMSAYVHELVIWGCLENGNVLYLETISFSFCYSFIFVLYYFLFIRKLVL